MINLKEMIEQDMGVKEWDLFQVKTSKKVYETVYRLRYSDMLGEFYFEIYDEDHLTESEKTFTYKDWEKSTIKKLIPYKH